MYRPGNELSKDDFTDSRITGIYIDIKNSIYAVLGKQSALAKLSFKICIYFEYALGYARTVAFTERSGLYALRMKFTDGNVPIIHMIILI